MHGIHGVEDQVGEGFPDLGGVAQDRGQGPEVSLDVDDAALALGLVLPAGAGDPERLLDQGAEGEGGEGPAPALAAEVPEAPGRTILRSHSHASAAWLSAWRRGSVAKVGFRADVPRTRESVARSPNPSNTTR